MAEDRGVALGLLIAAKVVCCGGLALAATGALAGLGSWFVDRWYVWAGAVIAVVLVLANRRRCKANAQRGYAAERVRSG